SEREGALSPEGPYQREVECLVRGEVARIVRLKQRHSSNRQPARQRSSLLEYLRDFVGRLDDVPVGTLLCRRSEQCRVYRSQPRFYPFGIPELDEFFGPSNERLEVGLPHSFLKRCTCSLIGSATSRAVRSEDGTNRPTTARRHTRAGGVAAL